MQIRLRLASMGWSFHGKLNRQLWTVFIHQVLGIELGIRIGLTEPAYALHRRQAYLNFDFHLPLLWVIHMVQYAHRNTGKKRHRDAAVF